MADYARAPAGAAEYEREADLRRQLVLQCRREYKLPLRIVKALMGALMTTLLVEHPRVVMDGGIVVGSLTVRTGSTLTYMCGSRYGEAHQCHGVAVGTDITDRAYCITVRDRTGRVYKCYRGIFTGVARPKRSGGGAGAK
jgi:hypothetical protein